MVASVVSVRGEQRAGGVGMSSSEGASLCDIYCSYYVYMISYYMGDSIPTAAAALPDLCPAESSCGPYAKGTFVLGPS